MAGKIIIFSAPSGTGKTTIIKRIMQEHPGLNLQFSVSACSRNKREGEINGKDYYFLTPDEFKQKILDNAFVEWEEVYKDTFYGTLKSEIIRIHGEGKNILFDVDVLGGINLKKIFGEKALALFIMPPSLNHLETRLRNRGTETEETLKKRLDRAALEISKVNEFDKVIVNDTLDTAIQDTTMCITHFVFSEGDD